MALELRVAFNAHLADCGKRSDKLSQDVRDSRDELSERLNSLTKMLVGAASTLVLGLFAVIVLLLKKDGIF